MHYFVLQDDWSISTELTNGGDLVTGLFPIGGADTLSVKLLVKFNFPKWNKNRCIEESRTVGRRICTAK